MANDGADGGLQVAISLEGRRPGGHGTAAREPWKASGACKAQRAAAAATRREVFVTNCTSWWVAGVSPSLLLIRSRPAANVQPSLGFSGLRLRRRYGSRAPGS